MSYPSYIYYLQHCCNDSLVWMNSTQKCHSHANLKSFILNTPLPLTNLYILFHLISKISIFRNLVFLVALIHSIRHWVCTDISLFHFHMSLCYLCFNLALVDYLSPISSQLFFRRYSKLIKLIASYLIRICAGKDWKYKNEKPSSHFITLTSLIPYSTLVVYTHYILH